MVHQYFFLKLKVNLLFPFPILIPNKLLIKVYSSIFPAITFSKALEHPDKNYEPCEFKKFDRD